MLKSLNLLINIYNIKKYLLYKKCLNNIIIQLL